MSGSIVAARDTGSTRRGPNVTPPCKPERQSEPHYRHPDQRCAWQRPRRMVRYGPTLAPSGSMAGKPSRKTAMSVVVPPISETNALSELVSHRAPTIEAAGRLGLFQLVFRAPDPVKSTHRHRAPPSVARSHPDQRVQIARAATTDQSARSSVHLKGSQHAAVRSVW